MYDLSRKLDCNTNHCLVVVKVRERLAVGKQAAKKFGVDRLNLRKLWELEVRKEYQIIISDLQLWRPSMRART